MKPIQFHIYIFIEINILMYFNIQVCVKTNYKRCLKCLKLGNKNDFIKKRNFQQVEIFSVGTTGAVRSTRDLDLSYLSFHMRKNIEKVRVRICSCALFFTLCTFLFSAHRVANILEDASICGLHYDGFYIIFFFSFQIGAAIICVIF